MLANPLGAGGGGAGKFKIPLMPGSAELVGAASEPLLIGMGGTNLNWSELRFNDTAINQANWIISGAMTANYAGGQITIRLRWKAAAITGAVLWQAQLIGRTTGEQIDTAMETARSFSATTVNGTTELTNNSELTFTSTAAELTAGDDWFIRILRKANDAADTMSGDAKLFSAQVFEV